MTGHVQDDLSAYLDQELSEEARRAVEAHLGVCPDCAQRLEELSQVDGLYRDLPATAPPDYFETLPGRVRERLPKRRPMRLPAWSWAPLAALVLLAITPLLLERHSAHLAPQPAAAPLGAAKEPPPTVLAAPSALPRPSEAQPTDKTALAKKRGGAVPLYAPAPVPREAVQAETKATTRAEPKPRKVEEENAVAQDQELDRLKSLDYAGEPASAAPGGSVGAPQAPPPFAAGAPSGVADGVTREDSADRARDRAVTPSAGQRQALARRPEALEHARATRERCRSLLKTAQAGTEAETRSYALVIASKRAYDLSGDPVDREILRKDAEAYLALENPPHAEDVRRILNSLPK
jgi:hypothetical protein